jgi:hypothetical protein
MPTHHQQFLRIFAAPEARARLRRELFCEFLFFAEAKKERLDSRSNLTFARHFLCPFRA